MWSKKCAKTCAQRYGKKWAFSSEQIKRLRKWK
nr:MAG TPA: hypothetical protein [Caudoviricetes sp.]